jgi:hypothetical protein
MEQKIVESKIVASPKDFFLYLGLVVTLYTSTFSLLNLLFEIINTAFPDKLQMYTDPYTTSIRIAIATLIIIFPIFLYISALIKKDIKNVPEKAFILVRKWLLFLTLFLAGTAIAVDLIVLLDTFLQGEIKMRFALKILSVLAVSGSIFSYYLYELKNNFTNKCISRRSALVSALTVLITIIVGFTIMGSPATARNRRFDETRINNLNSIQWQLTNYWQSKNRLPERLAELKDPISGFEVPTDPETNSPYEYNPVSENGFELCAVFTTNSGDTTRDISVPLGKTNWSHGVGRTCFNNTIDKELYPPYATKAVPVIR